MKVKVIMIPKSKTKCIQADDTVAEALKLIDENGLLSLPVVEGKKVFGILSKRYVYEQYFKEEQVDRQEFLSRSVRSFIRTKLMTVRENTRIVEAAELFIGWTKRMSWPESSPIRPFLRNIRKYPVRANIIR